MAAVDVNMGCPKEFSLKVSSSGRSRISKRRFLVLQKFSSELVEEQKRIHNQLYQYFKIQQVQLSKSS